MISTRHVDTHPLNTTYDVLVLGHAARCRYVPLTLAKHVYQYMRDEGADPVLVAHLPDGTRITGCYF